MCHDQFGVICLQESWLADNFEYSMFNLRNYSMIKQGKLCSEHGGLIIYVHDRYDISAIFNIARFGFWVGISMYRDLTKSAIPTKICYCKCILTSK